MITVGLFVYLYLPAVMLDSRYILDTGYNLTILLSTIGTFVACKIFPFNIVANESNNNERYRPKQSFFQVGAYLYAGYLVFQILSSIYSAGGILAAFRVNRLQSYLSGDMINNSLVINFAKEGLKIFFYYYFVMVYESGNKIKAIILFLIPMIHHRFTAVTRYDFIAMAASLAIYLVYRSINRTSIDKKLQILEGNTKKRIKPIRIVIIGVIGIYLALVFMRIANYTRFGSSATNLDLSFNALLKAKQPVTK